VIVASIRALAPILGMSHTALNGHLKRGKFAAEPGGGFDPDKVRAALKRNADLEQPSQAKGSPQSTPAQRPAPQPEREAPADDSSHADYNRARAYREKLRAKREEMDLKARMGELLDAAEVEKTWSQIITSVRARVLLLPDKLAPRIVAVSDVLECRAIIDREVREVLTALTEYQPNAA